MARTRRFPELSASDLHRQARLEQGYAADRQRLQQQGEDMQRLRLQTGRLQSGGVSRGLLPEITNNMSAADMATARAKMNALDPLAGGGRTSSDPLASLTQMVRDPDGSPSLQPGEARGVVDAERMRRGLPSNSEAEASESTRAKIQAAAGTGQVVQTPYGPVSSKPPTAIEHLDDIHGKDWQQKIVAQHPEIGVAGSPANAAFVKSLQTSLASDPGNKDIERNPFTIAKNVYDQPKSDVTGMGGELYKSPVSDADIKAPPPIGQPLAPVMFGGFNAGPANVAQYVPPSTATEAGQAFRGGINDAASMVFDPLKNAANAVGSMGSRAIAGGINFVNGVLGRNAPEAHASDKPLFQSEPAAPTTAPQVEYQPLPAFDWKSGSTQPTSLSMQNPQLPAWAGGFSTESPISDFSHNEEDDEFQKRLRSNYANDGR